ncbi:MAG: hypothetical protein HYZ53_21100 [Planctomycetes bacterium]|nr:hypothetical protein [Planctomycetota bacterium]
MSTWLDQVTAVPTIGLLTEVGFLSTQEYVSILRPTLEKFCAAAKSYAIDSPGPMNLLVRTSDGFNYKFDETNVVVDFKALSSEARPMGSSPSSGSAPPSPSLPFSNLLDMCIERILQLWEPLAKIRPRRLQRIGLMATGVFDPGPPAPGVAAFVGHLEHPWPLGSRKLAANVLAILEDEVGVRTQCHHMIQMNKSEEGATLALQLDWQRVWTVPREAASGQMASLLGECKTAAIDYFERFGRGELRYASKPSD